MNKWIFLFLFILEGTLAFSSPDDREKKSVEKNQDLSFEEILVQGKHHFSDEAINTVKRDKILDSLLEIPRDFKDRIKMSSERN